MPEEKKIGPISPEVSPQPLPREEGKIEGEQQREEEGSHPIAREERPRESSVTQTPTIAIPLTPSLPRHAVAKSEELQAIERILEEGLQDTYWQLSPSVQAKLKQRGEKTAEKIERLLRAMHLNVLKVLKLIRKWLSTIPRVNGFFLEQEAKIKTDKIIDLHKSRPKT